MSPEYFWKTIKLKEAGKAVLGRGKEQSGNKAGTGAAHMSAEGRMARKPGGEFRTACGGARSPGGLKRGRCSPSCVLEKFRGPWGRRTRGRCSSWLVKVQVTEPWLSKLVWRYPHWELVAIDRGRGSEGSPR